MLGIDTNQCSGDGYGWVSGYGGVEDQGQDDVEEEENKDN